MKLFEAKNIADEVIKILTPYCERIEIAGSVRREKPEVKDIEIVIIPKMLAMGDLFDDSANKVSVFELESSPIARIGKAIKNGMRYKQIESKYGINIDLFIVLPPAQWGVIFAIRTGDAFFSHWLVMSEKRAIASPTYSGTSYIGALRYYAKVSDGGVYDGGRLIAMPEEIDFLNYVGIGYIEPKERDEFCVKKFENKNYMQRQRKD